MIGKVIKKSSNDWKSDQKKFQRLESGLIVWVEAPDSIFLLDCFCLRRWPFFFMLGAD
jgi:hypothetical protein